MQQFKQSESTAARRRFYFHLVDASDGLTPETGEAGGQPQISKNGAGSNNTSATLVAIDTGTNGAYYVELTAAELDTLGVIMVRYKSANTAEFQDIAYVVAFDPYDAAGLGLSRIDAAISTRAPESGGNVEAIRERTDNLPDYPADQVTALSIKSQTDLIPADIVLQLDTNIPAIKANTDDIPDLPVDIDAELSSKHGAGSWQKGTEYEV